MKIALSNIALPVAVESAAWHSLAAAGLAGVEVALTRIAPWDSLDRNAVLAYRQRLEASGLSVPSLQAVLYGVPDAHLLKDDDQFETLETHLRRVARLGHLLGAGVAVFGAPKQRQRCGLSAEAAFELGVTRLRRLAEAVTLEGSMVLALEAAPEGYGGDFLTTAADVLAMVKAVAHRGLRMNFDTGCAFMAGEDLRDAVHSSRDYIVHVQASEPQLGHFRTPAIDHAAAAAALRQVDYQGWVSIEMRESATDPLAECVNALSYIKGQYLAAATHQGGSD